MITEKQEKLLRFLKSQTAENRYQPSIREMAFHMGVSSTNAIDQQLKSLEKKGFISRIKGKSRAINILK